VLAIKDSVELCANNGQYFLFNGDPHY